MVGMACQCKDSFASKMSLSLCTFFFFETLNAGFTKRKHCIKDQYHREILEKTLFILYTYI